MIAHTMAARLLDVPMASVTIVDSDRIWFKAAHGLEGVSEIGRDPGLCASAILRDDALVISDALADAVACSNPLVAGPMGVRFYAAAPIITADGYRLGTVNVLDTHPRLITSAHTATLADLAAVVMDELELRLSALGTVRAEQAQREAEHQRAESERVAREQAERDKTAIATFAATLQRTLLPPALPTVPGLELACHYHTASTRDVGGDFYDVFPLGSGQWAFFLGDVCGKGAEAAAVTSLTRYTLRAAAHIDPDPEAVLTTLNTALLMDPSIGSRFCTAVFGVLAPEEQGAAFTVTLATGGHPPAYHLSPGEQAHGTRVEPVQPKGGMLIGAFAQAHFATTTMRLAPGQALLLYTDGLTEARTQEGGMLGEDGLTAFLAQRPTPLSAADLVKDTAALLDAMPDGPGDDVALLALSVPTNPAAPRGATATAHTTASPAPVRRRRPPSRRRAAGRRGRRSASFWDEVGVLRTHPGPGAPPTHALGQQDPSQLGAVHLEMPRARAMVVSASRVHSGGPLSSAAHRSP
ncbi:SpoIIE family protein phosphatase [Streptomyces sp. H10-C2]|uniref:PP2C family protein-serine/threonine phosphatase n=1 Tax=unclassified Streptomyces TaxID=2593676 RepID=UPI0024BA7847|nr:MULTISPECIES: GAF domain-containing SpoIIE family protein phosphatase [unclassified Streptomyces]MDJ0347344.1 SpoIIE family protein phosphatase [Streptomyces sp. PH10-H1]MDJ0375561.1 SpoIIE family protein phosphatase [Streptomyces sp. H10-C2]